MPGIQVQKSSAFHVSITVGNTVYGGCAADVSGDWDTPVQVLTHPGSKDVGGNAVCNDEILTFFGDTTGNLTITELVLTSITTPTTSSTYTIDLSAASSIVITSTVPAKSTAPGGPFTYTATFPSAAYNVGDNYSLVPIGQNLYYTKSAIFTILDRNS